MYDYACYIYYTTWQHVSWVCYATNYYIKYICCQLDTNKHKKITITVQ